MDLNCLALQAWDRPNIHHELSFEMQMDHHRFVLMHVRLLKSCHEMQRRRLKRKRKRKMMTKMMMNSNSRQIAMSHLLES